MDNIINDKSCSIVLDVIGRRAYINSERGRAELLADCTTYNRQDLYDEVMAVWGDAPTVIEPVEPEPTFDELKTQKKADIAAARYVAETGGVTVSGATIDTDRDSQALITGAALAAVIDNSYSLNWKTESGFVHLTNFIGNFQIVQNLIWFEKSAVVSKNLVMFTLMACV